MRYRIQKHIVSARADTDAYKVRVQVRMHTDERAHLPQRENGICLRKIQSVSDRIFSGTALQDDGTSGKIRAHAAFQKTEKMPRNTSPAF